jgi:hypothetical protein
MKFISALITARREPSEINVCWKCESCLRPNDATVLIIVTYDVSSAMEVFLEGNDVTEYMMLVCPLASRLR